jgi:hypothetical protein
VPKNLLIGAYGVPAPPPTAAMKAHPERVVRFSRFLFLLWCVRIGVAALLLTVLLYVTHVI